LSENKHANDGGLIIDPAILSDIQRQCRERAAELARTGTLGRSMEGPGSSQSGFGMAQVPPPIPATLSEAERLAAAVQEMPARIRAFFEREDPAPARRRESVADRAERERLTDLGGWCG
jgi:hypothetical protein